MAQVSYGTITITDTNDIERIYVEYCRSTSNQLSGTTVPNITRAWGETTPAWVDGEYIWQRTVVEESGTQRKTYGTPVCISGEKGETGDQGPQGIQGGTGAAGRSLKSTTTHYTTAIATATIDETNMGNYTWSSDVPTYNASTPAYWVRVTNVYENPSSTAYIFYKDNGISDAVKTSHDANSTAASANSTANAANQTANTANNTANNANTKADQAVTNVNNLQAKLKYYWVNEVNHTNGVSGWTKPNYPVGTYAASGISGTTFDSENSSTYGYNTWYANGINLRYNAINLGQLTGTSLIFYHPSTSSQGGKAMELTGSALKFYDSTGSVAQATFGGTQATISGTINVYDGKIGNGSNYWYIGNYTDYNQNDSAIIKSIGTASIQLNETNTWRIATNRIHTAWAPESGTDAYKLHFPVFNDKDNNSKHWDFGLHLPTSNSDKFLYIRNAASTQSLDNLLNDLDDAGYNYWTYKFYVDSEGNLHAGDIYSHGTLISGTSAPYLLKSGGTITGDLTVNGTITGTLSGTASNANTVNNLTVQTAVPANAVFTDTKVTQTASTGSAAYELLFSATADNTTRTEGARKTSTLTYNPSTKALSTGGTINGYTLAAASAKGVDTSLTASSTSANLPTSAAVANLIKQYLPLSGGNVTGSVTFGSSVSADELTVGDLVVNGAASFTNNLQANTINGVEVGANPKFTDTVTTVTVTGNGNAVTGASASNGAVTLTKGATFLTSYTETDPIFVASAAYGISSTDISNWNSKTSNTGTVTKVTAGTGLKIGTATSGSDITTTGTINHINSVTAKTAAAQSAKTLTWGGTFTLYEEKYDAQGHVTGVANYNMTMPANPNTHNTAYLYAGKSDGTANAATTNGNTYLILMDGGSATTRRKISGSGTVSVASDASGNITITGSAHPTSLKNPNALTVNVYNATTQTTSGYSTTTYDGSVANQSVNVAGNNAITKITSNEDGQLVVQRASGAAPETVTVKITATTSDTSASADKLNLSADVGSLTQPVYFDGNTGLPVATTYSLNKTVPSNAIFTDTWIAMVGATSSANGTAGYVSAPPKDGYNTKFLRADGTWVVPGGTYSLPLAANGIRGGVQIGYTANGKNYPVQLSSEKMYVNVPWENTNYYHKTGSWSGLTYTAAKVGSPDDLAFTIPTGTTSTTVAIGNHTHGNITNGGDITATAPTIANGDQLVINDSSESKITNGPTFDGSTTTKALTPKGTWETFSQFSGSYNDLADKPTIPTVPSNIVNTITTTAGAHTAISNKTGNVSFNVPTTAAHVGIKFGYTTSGNNRAVLQDTSGNLYVTQKDDNTNYYHTTGSWGGTNNLTYTATANGGVGALAFTLATASTSAYGVTKLSSTASSTEQGLAATPKLVYDSINNATNKYVTLDTNQTLTAAGTKTYFGLQTYGSNGVAFGTTSGTSVTQKANVKYDATLDALVFTFA